MRVLLFFLLICITSACTFPASLHHLRECDGKDLIDYVSEYNCCDVDYERLKTEIGKDCFNLLYVLVDKGFDVCN